MDCGFRCAGQKGSEHHGVIHNLLTVSIPIQLFSFTVGLGCHGHSHGMPESGVDVTVRYQVAAAPAAAAEWMKLLRVIFLGIFLWQVFSCFRLRVDLAAAET